jgi:peptidoglycan L-alanyl-D-glutamate endopeptidase CwlK
MYVFGPKSKAKLSKVHPDLARVIKGALRITEVDFFVTEGIRTLARQKRLVASGDSDILNSRHLTGHAVDIAAWVDKKVNWDFDLYKIIARAVKTSAKVLDIPIEWGGDWEGIDDGPHFELTREAYPDDKES